ncbi:MAG TPA: Tad domain-containing protein [Terriglobia bacterium]|nr:Tad domain-containing protein [Terriglobia bacterium]
MKTKPSKEPGGKLPGDAGQATLFVVLIMGLFLLAGLGFAVDLANAWFHRQNAQNGADAACTAGIMDMLYSAEGIGSATWFSGGNQVSDCSGNGTIAPCWYAAKNGYSGAHTANGNPSVALSYPTTLPGIPPCSGSPPPPTCVATGFTSAAYLTVNIDDSVSTFFSGLISGSKTMDVGAKASCALVLANSPIPLLVLDPTDSNTLSGNGKINITIIGGPQRSIQVDSNSGSATGISGGSGTIDLSHGGPLGTGSDYGNTGSESQPGILTLGSTSNYISPDPPISDPFSTLAAPTQPGNSLTGPYQHVLAGTNGCQDTTNGCGEYEGGYYPSGITVKKSVDGGSDIFDPGVYYMAGNLSADSNSCMRPSTATGDGSGGTMFYFSGTATVAVGANAGTYGVCGTTTTVPLTTIRCINSGTGTTQLPANIVTLGGLEGNVLLGPCQAPTAGGTNYGDPLGTADPLGEQRGMLFFQSHSSTGAAPGWSGGGAFGLMGIMYFHSSTDTGTSADTLSLGGGSASNTFVVGDIVTDKLSMAGNPTIEMDLNPNALFYVLKATLLQ